MKENPKRFEKKWIACPDEEHYLKEDRKEGKKQIKLARKQDRSKYKKTDLEKTLPKQEEAGNAELFLGEKGRVLSIKSEGIMVEKGGKLFRCHLRGSLKQEKTLAKNLVTVGDFVLIEELNKDEGVILEILPRRSQLSRADNLSRRKEQLIAANIDQVMITASILRPELKPSLIDRYVIAAKKGNMQPVIVITKIDLLDDPKLIEPLKEKMEFFLSELEKAYPKEGIPFVKVSTVTGEGMELLKKLMKDKASVFSGQSGVGKSSLINEITGENLKVGDVVEKTQKGAHTTTSANLVVLSDGGFCIDTPGIKSFGVWDLKQEEIKGYFSEIEKIGKMCHFPNCHHLHEEHCAVKQAVEKGKISLVRYESYLALMLSSQEEYQRR